MKKTISLTILLLGCLFLSDEIAAQTLSQGAQKNELRADSLYRRYEFARAAKIYAQMAQTAEPQDKSRLELKSIACQNGEAMLQYVSTPTIVTRKVLEKNDFFLYYPKISTVGHFIHAPAGLASTSDTLYLPDNKNTLYYSTKDNYGVWNIFITRKQPDGSWSAPESLGSNVNSKGNELFPFLSPDGKRLYFSSNGHYGAGGYDLYVSVWDESKQEWGVAQNMGFPYSSPSDDFFFYITPDGKYAAFSSTRLLDQTGSRLFNSTKVICYVVEYEDDPIKHPATSQEAYELSLLRSAVVLTQEQRDSISNAAVEKALEGVERKNATEEMDSTARKITENYTLATQKFRQLRAQREKLQASQAAYRAFYTELNNRLSREEDPDEIFLKKDSIKFMSNRIAESESAMLAVSQQLREVSREIRAIEEGFMASGIDVPANTAFKSSEQLKAETETGVAQEDDENIARLLAVKSPVVAADNFKVERIRPEVDLKFKIQKKGTLVDLEDFPQGLIYQIRFTSSAKKLATASFKGLTPVFERNTGGRFVYTAGCFAKYSEANRQLSRVKKLGFSSATIVAYENGTAIPLDVARKKEAAAKQAAQIKTTPYKVVIISTESALESQLMKLIQSTGKDIAKSATEEGYKFVSGPYPSEKDAQELADRIKAISDKKVYIEAVN